ncbi:hypothetical protein MBAV_003035 [Candidatus Magnetobacterium bavaricum]|uniref:Uncharacterized protein n=1 Tax=Candidatus Magnetobacterium bavaricum TaxID=29290 RepID=A0A0F3GS85_9BACT|nr:hypothetical protein MBAV_003035 [Candidatus Magnetobacterium bavaricum]
MDVRKASGSTTVNRGGRYFNYLTQSANRINRPVLPVIEIVRNVFGGSYVQER